MPPVPLPRFHDPMGNIVEPIPGVRMDLSRVGGMPGHIANLAAVEQRHMDPANVKLKNPPQPYTGPQPKVTIPIATHPHIIGSIVNHAGKEALLALRATCKLLNRLVDREFARHIEVCSDYIHLRITARHLGRIPSLRFKGKITLGCSYAKEVDEMGQLGQLFSQMLMQACAPPTDVWLRVQPSSVAWLTEFMSHVHTVDMDGESMPPPVYLTRERQVGRDPLGRVYVDPFPVKHIRMYPGADGGFANVIPFTAPRATHPVYLLDPEVRPEATWLHAAPPIPQGTKTLAIVVPIHPDVPPLSAAGALHYPASLKTVAIAIGPHPEGEPATAGAFLALQAFWTKVFSDFSPGIKFYVHDIHRWENVGLPYGPRELVLMAACMTWMPEVKEWTKEMVWATAGDHVVFIRGGMLMDYEGVENGGTFNVVMADGSLAPCRRVGK